MERETLFAVLLGVLLVVSIFQSTQLVGLTEKVKTASLYAAPAVPAPATSVSSSGSAPSGSALGNLQNLPSQVGGC